ncbi:MAG TPA: DUF4382 domain-containing protein [Gemmatimonadaceae bacterium]|nr:DUF4382 domain-containing protein [Gemmatimonadaceae bacterium]
MLSARLTDAPIALDSVKEVNVFVVRIDARRARVVSDTDLDANIDHDDGVAQGEWMHADSSRWVTIAEPNQAFNLLALQGGVTAFLGATPVDSGQYRAIRLVIDPLQSTIVLKDGTVLSATSDPPVEFENRGRHALLVEFDDSVEVHEGQTTSVVLDIRLASSLTLRGRTIHDGFFFRPAVVGHCEHEH